MRSHVKVNSFRPSLNLIQYESIVITCVQCWELKRKRISNMNMLKIPSFGHGNGYGMERHGKWPDVNGRKAWPAERIGTRLCVTSAILSASKLFTWVSGCRGTAGAALCLLEGLVPLYVPLGHIRCHIWMLQQMLYKLLRAWDPCCINSYLRHAYLIHWQHIFFFLDLDMFVILCDQFQRILLRNPSNNTHTNWYS